MLAGAAIYVLGLGVMAAAGGAPALIVSGVLIGIALSCTASSLALTATARAIPEHRRSKVLGMLLIPLTTQALLAYQAWQVGVMFFLLLAVTMLPAGFFAGAVDRLPGAGAPRTTMRAMIG